MIYGNYLSFRDTLYLVSIAVFLLFFLVQFLLDRRVKKYSKITLHSGKTGAEIAKEMLDAFFIDDVKIVETEGFLTDHYNPITKTLNLSPDVYNGISACSAGIAAHECGHAIQHNRGYFFLYLRSLMVPMVSFSSKFLNIFIILGFVMINVSLLPLEIGVILYFITTLFSIVTLPVEFNASSRAVDWLDENNIVDNEELKYVKGALRLAAMTYVLSAILSLTELLRLILILNDRKRD